MTDAPTLARRERDGVCAALLAAGPDAPTLCGDWRSHDLVAHLFIRERRPDAGPGLLVPAFAGWTARVQAGARRQPFAQLVAAVRSGPPTLSVFALPGADALLNTVEYLVHHEDVRRGVPGWQPRELDAADQQVVWTQLRLAARRSLARAPVPVQLRRGREPDQVLRGGPADGPAVVVSGEPVELLLFTLGRQAQAQVELDGPADAVARLTGAPLGY
jgi:uncharacterized protein (TIGR03085 family)